MDAAMAFPAIMSLYKVFRRNECKQKTTTFASTKPLFTNAIYVQIRTNLAKGRVLLDMYMSKRTYNGHMESNPKAGKFSVDYDGRRKMSSFRSSGCALRQKGHN